MKFRYILFAIALALFPLKAYMQAAKPFKGRFVCDANKITMQLDLYETSLEAPGLSFLGKVNGYMHGAGVYGVWLLTGFSVKDGTATLRMSNDTGSDSQTIEFKMQTDSLFHYKAVGGNAVKKAQGRRLVKIEPEMDFRRR